MSFHLYLAFAQSADRIEFHHNHYHLPWGLYNVTKMISHFKNKYLHQCSTGPMASTKENSFANVNLFLLMCCLHADPCLVVPSTGLAFYYSLAGVQLTATGPAGQWAVRWGLVHARQADGQTSGCTVWCYINQPRQAHMHRLMCDCNQATTAAKARARAFAGYKTPRRFRAVRKHTEKKIT